MSDVNYNKLRANKVIQDFGLTRTETNVYLGILELGESTISDVAKSTHLTRSTCYSAIERLITLGLVNILRIGSGKIYRAENPEKFIQILKEREERMKDVLPLLKSRYKSDDVKGKIYGYDGVEGVRFILEDILNKQFPLSAITSIDSAFEVLGEDFRDFIERRHKKHLRVRLLTVRTKESLELRKNDNAESRVTKFLPGDHSLATANFIYGNRLAIISLVIKKPFGLIIEDPALVQTYLTLFDIAWSHSI